MKRLLRFIFDHHFFAERILFIAIAGGMLVDGIFTGAFESFSPEAILRVCISVFAVGALLYTYVRGATRRATRILAYLAISSLLGLSAFLCVHNHFDYDDALTLLGAYLICSLYFRTFSELLLYLILGLLLQVASVYITDHPHIDPVLYVVRNGLGAILVIGLSQAMRQFQQNLQQFSRRVAEENRSLTATKDALEEKLTHEHLLALVASRANTAVMITDAFDRIEWVNDGFTEITGYRNDEVTGKSPAFMRGEGTDPATVNFIEQMKKKREPFHATILNYNRSGEELWLQLHVTPLLNANGETERYITIQEDITGIKNRETELRRNREQLKRAQQQAKIGSWELVEQNGIIEMSEEMATILGLPSADSVPYEATLDRVHPDDREVVKRSIENGFRRRSPFEMEFRAIVDGNVKTLYLTAQAFSYGKDRHDSLTGTLQDITERKKIEEEMQMAEKQYRSLFENSQHMICMHNMAGEMMSINQAGAHAAGYEPEEVIGMNISEFLFSKNRNDFEKYMDVIRASGSANGLVKVKLRNGRSLVWLYNNVLLTGPDGSPFVLCSNVDITGRVELEKELRKATKAAEEALQLKDAFVTNISHELRTPMNAIVGFTELILKTKLSDDQKEYVNAINLAGTNLTRMINDILDLAKIEAGRIEFDSRPFQLTKVFEETHLLLSQSAAAKGLELAWKMDPLVPAYIVGDDHRLSQILINLIGNAIKFTDDGYVHFSSHILSEDAENVSMEILVVDTGIGIPEQKLKDVFEPFSQGSAESTRKYGGTGLGLSIVKNLVELQGGTVEVKSEIGKGSIFRVFLTYKKVGPDSVEKVGKALAPKELDGELNVLIVEDQPLNQQLAARLMQDFGFRFKLATNGKEAIGLLKEEHFDLVMMDLQMPVMDGYEAAQIIRREMKMEIPMIAVTAHSSAGEREHCTEIGFNDYLTKPYRAQELYFRIVSLLGKELPSSKLSIEDEDHPLRSLSGGDKKFEYDMLGLMLRSIPEDFSRLASFLDAGNSKEAAAIAHKLRSAIALTGDRELTLLMEEIESETKKGELNGLKEKMDIAEKRKDLLMLRIREEYRSLGVD
jgi:PAS domain S-box-containing protein